jgi:EF-P beta-lysylation protein EpmB
MIPLYNSWQQQLRKNIRSAKKLCELLELSEEQEQKVLKRSPFCLNIPERLVLKMEKGRIDSPLFRQFVPLAEEQVQVEGYSCDPLQESSFHLTPRLLQKYGSRALLVTTSACAMHCRYCFRRHFPYEKTASDFSQELLAISEDVNLLEVILSGGDPLSLPDERLFPFLEKLDAIEHVRIIRFHTRFPIGIPERITEAFTAKIASLSKSVVVVLHINHPDELDCDVLEALNRLKKAGATLLNQSVLLKGVNDEYATLKRLCENLAFGGILPYYLHLLDEVDGAHHFAVEEEKGKALLIELRKELPGYAVPRLAKEIPGKPHKTILL